MLKHNDIISALTLPQKVKMLTGAGSLTGKDMKILKGAVAKVEFCCGSFSHQFSTFQQQKRGKKASKCVYEY